MTPTETTEGNYLEEARLAFVTIEPIAQVNSTEQRGVQETSNSLAGTERFVGKVNIAFNSKAEYRSKIATDAQASV